MLRFTLCLLLGATLVQGQDALKGAWTNDQADAILEKALHLHLQPDLSSLTKGEQEAVSLLLQVGEIMHTLYLDAQHHESLAVVARLEAAKKEGNDPTRVERLNKLFHMFKGGYLTTPDNKREAFMPMTPELSGRNFYPLDVEQTILEAWMKDHEDQRANILATRTVVRRATAEQIAADRAVVTKHPWLKALHPQVVASLDTAQVDEEGYYAVPYALAWADALLEASNLLHRAGDAVAKDDPDLSAYLHNRGRDMLGNNYESGDASWVAGRFKNLNAQIGAYETYEDSLFGVKGAFSLSLLIRDEALTKELNSAIGGIQELEKSLPYDHHKSVREDLPVGVYQVIADFGQARGTNTATILPNNPDFARKYGRTILLRHNILANPELYKITAATWKAAVLDKHASDITLEANFYRTLWHEIGHYLGPSKDKNGRDLVVAMGQYSDLMEELKADLVSLYAVPFLEKRGFYTPEQGKAVRAAGIYRTLQKARPRSNQPYQSMQLMQLNSFLASPVLTFRPGNGKRLEINYDAYDETVAKMLKNVLALQYEGDQGKVKNYIMGLSMWSQWLHEDLAKNLREASAYRYRLVTYEALK